MSTKWTRRFVNFLIFIFVLAGVVAVVQAASAISEGKFHMVSYPAVSENIEMQVLDPGGDNDAFWQLQDGSIRVDNHTWLATARLMGRLVALGLFAAVFWQLRGVLTRIGEGNVFTDENVASLRRIGKLLVIGSVLSISITFMTQFAIIDAIPELTDRAIHPSISWRVQGVENIWLDYSPPILPMLMAMVAFITAGAFKSGQHYREDSESVV